MTLRICILLAGAVCLGVALLGDLATPERAIFAGLAVAFLGLASGDLLE